MTMKSYKYRFVRVIIKDSSGKILVLNHIKHKQSPWNFPGGKLNSNESFVDAARREIFEETGLFVQEMIFLTERSVEISRKLWFGQFFLAINIIGKVSLKEPSRCSELGFKSLNEIKALNANQSIFQDIVDLPKVRTAKTSFLNE